MGMMNGDYFMGRNIRRTRQLAKSKPLAGGRRITSWAAWVCEIQRNDLYQYLITSLSTQTRLIWACRCHGFCREGQNTHWVL